MPMKLWNSLRFSELSEQVKPPQQFIHRERVQQDKLKRVEIKDQLDNQNIFLQICMLARQTGTGQQ